jgi:hypothetical protein
MLESGHPDVYFCSEGRNFAPIIQKIGWFE